ncbi:MAG: SLC13 family permease [Negativicutes bacterium]
MDLGITTFISIAVLFAMFAIGELTSLNLGILGFVSSFVIGNFMMGVSVNTILKGFPVSLFVILIGVTYFFNTLRDNGVIDLIVHWGLKLVRGKIWLIPWVMYLLSLSLSFIGTQGTATVVIVAPIALMLANKCGINQIMMSMMVAFGMFGGVYSPLNVLGILVGGVMDKLGLPFSYLSLNLNMILFTTGLSLVAFLIFGGLRLFKAGAIDLASLGTNQEGDIIGKDVQLSPYRVISLLGLLGLIVLGLALKLNMGFSAMFIALLLGLIQPKRQKEIISKIPWNVILLICGIVTYIELMQEIGVMKYLESMINSFNNPKLTALAAAYIGGFISAFASTSATIIGIIPMVRAVFDDPSIWPPGLIACIVISSTIVDICPFSPTGALFVANAQGAEKETFYKRLIITAGVVVLLGPGLTWLILVAIP